MCIMVMREIGVTYFKNKNDHIIHTEKFQCSPIVSKLILPCSISWSHWDPYQINAEKPSFSKKKNHFFLNEKKIMKWNENKHYNSIKLQIFTAANHKVVQLVILNPLKLISQYNCSCTHYKLFWLQFKKKKTIFHLNCEISLWVSEWAPNEEKHQAKF